MQKEITILVKMLNGSLKALPKFMHQTIIQYQCQQVVMGVLFLAFGVVCIYCGYRLLKKRTELQMIDAKRDYAHKIKVDLDDFWGFGIYPLGIALLGLTCFCVYQGITHIGNAISPITSLIFQLKGLQ